MPTKRPAIWISPKASPQLKKFKPALLKLGKVHKDYMRADGWQDYSFWYGERTHIGFLAAAVWLTGGSALEEYGTKKSRGKKHGRCDLFVRMKEGEPGFECESKRIWVNLARGPSKCSGQIHRGLNRAYGDVRRDYSGKGISLCFTVIGGAHFLSAKEVKARVKKLRLRMSKSKNCDAVVWLEKPNVAQFKVNEFRNQIGVLLAIKEKR